MLVFVLPSAPGFWICLFDWHLGRLAPPTLFFRSPSSHSRIRLPFKRQLTFISPTPFLCRALLPTQAIELFRPLEDGDDTVASTEAGDALDARSDMRILPEFVFVLEADDAFLRDRVMALPEHEVAGPSMGVWCVWVRVCVCVCVGGCVCACVGVIVCVCACVRFVPAGG